MAEKKGITNAIFAVKSLTKTELINLRRNGCGKKNPAWPPNRRREVIAHCATTGSQRAGSPSSGKAVM